MNNGELCGFADWQIDFLENLSLSQLFWTVLLFDWLYSLMTNISSEDVYWLNLRSPPAWIFSQLWLVGTAFMMFFMMMNSCLYVFLNTWWKAASLQLILQSSYCIDLTLSHNINAREQNIHNSLLRVQRIYTNTNKLCLYVVHKFVECAPILPSTSMIEEHIEQSCPNHPSPPLAPCTSWNHIFKTVFHPWSNTGSYCKSGFVFRKERNK